MECYGQNPSVTYLRVSDDEVIARGGHLDGFSLIISDDTGRGLASRIVDELADGASAQAIHSALSDSHDITVEEIEGFLEEMHESGVALKLGQDRATMADWLAFARFGEIVSPTKLCPLVILGSDVAAKLVERLRELGLEAEYRSWDEFEHADLDEFAVASLKSDPRGELEVSHRDRANGDDSSEVPDARDERDDRTADGPDTRLVVVADSGSLQALYALNERAVAAGIPVFYLQVAGVEFAVGPYVVPDTTACFWEFERQRARSLFSYSEYAVMAAGALREDRRTPPAVAQHGVLAAAAPFLVELALLGESSLAGQVLRGRATTAETARHFVMRLPRCPVCLPLRPTIRNPLF